mmetsp:Transcript_4174/g.13729  ORF Transcript_4174/g.13729 Transcript_4174/m.13729 type:complete len:728 (-) Transcript_4174:940-3123(-)
MHRVRSDVRDTLTNATLHFIGRADEIDTNYPDTMLCKAIFWMNQCSSDGRALENAAYYASAVLRLKNCSMAAKLANGIIAFHERSYCQALGLFLASLQYKQPFRGTIYAAIGVCAMCLDEMRVASCAFERALALEPTNVGGLVFIASLRAANVRVHSPLDETAMRLTTKAIELDHAFSPALSQLAHCLFWNWRRAFRARVINGSRELLCKEGAPAVMTHGCDVRLGSDGDDAVQARVVDVHYDDTGTTITLSDAVHLDESRVTTGTSAELTIFWRNTPLIEELASRAYHSTEDPATRAEAYFILGRTHHARGDLEQAVLYYSQACKLDPNYTLAHFRLAQAHAARGELEVAAERATEANRLMPKINEVMLLLAAIELDCGRPDDIHDSLMDSARLNSVAFVTVGSGKQAAAESGGSRALVECSLVYERLIDSHFAESSLPPTCELWNNLGVVCVGLKRVDQAKTAFLNAIERICSARIGYEHMADSVSSCEADVKKDQLIVVCTNLAQVLTLTGASKPSRQTMNGLLRLAPRSAQYQMLTAAAQTTLGNLVEVQMHILAGLRIWSISKQLAAAGSISSSSMHPWFLCLCLNLLPKITAGDVFTAFISLNHENMGSCPVFFSRTLQSMFILHSKGVSIPAPQPSVRPCFMKVVSEQCGSSLSEAPGCAAAAFTLGLVSAERGEYDRALMIYRKFDHMVHRRAALIYSSQQTKCDPTWIVATPQGHPAT